MVSKMKILLAEPSDHVAQSILRSKRAQIHQITHVHTGPECLSAVEKDSPDIVIIDIMTPVMHGIEILRKIREQYPDLGVIITTFQTMAQNYRAAIEAGANYFLPKPFDINEFFDLVEKHQTSPLQPVQLPLDPGMQYSKESCYAPKPSVLTSYIKFWGTRGSNPVSGNEYVRYGGNTCCIEVRHHDTLAIIDAGTGIRPLGEQLAQENHENYHLFIGHTHWDHITGFPFFTPIYQKNGDIIVWSPVGFEKSTKELFTDMLAYAYFPVRLEEMHSKIMFKEMRDTKPIRVGDLLLDTYHTNHPGPTLGFKIISPNKTIGYITDNEMLMGYLGHPNDITSDHPLLEPHLGLIEFLKGCDIVIHEAQYLSEEYVHKIGWGHSSIPNATVLIREVGCKEWIVTHHEPTHTDEMLQLKAQLHRDILSECNIDCSVELAYDGYMIPLDTI